MTVEEMNQEEIDSFLRNMNTGVLSLTTGTETYAIPESFGYDGEALYFQFVYTEESHKMKVVETTDIATLTAFTETPTKSVIVRGDLEMIPEAENICATSALTRNATPPLLNVYPKTPSENLSFKFYRLNIATMSGRKFGESVVSPLEGLPDRGRKHLENALDASDPSEKDNHIRQFLQAYSSFPE